MNIIKIESVQSEYARQAQAQTHLNAIKLVADKFGITVELVEKITNEVSK